MNAGDALGATLLAGLLGIDPLGVIIALAALGAGARRGGISALTVSFLASMAVLGSTASLAVRALSRTGWVLAALAFARTHHLAGRVELVVGVAILLAGVALGVRSLRRRGAPVEAPGTRLLDRITDRLSSPATLAVVGVALAVNLIPDPGFAVLAVASREWPLWWWPVAWTLWGALSQILLIGLWLALLPGSATTRIHRLSAVTRAVVARSAGVAWLAAVLLGTYLIADALTRL